MKSKLLITHSLSVITVCIFLLMLVGSSEDSDNNASNSAESNSEKIQTPQELREQLSREIESFNKPFDGSGYSGSVESVQIELALFAVWANIITNGENSDDPENQRLAADLKKKVISLQVKEFPKMRKRYVTEAAKVLWENDIYVTVQGATNGIINISGGIFAANKNIQDTQNTLNDVLTQFRFKEARYRWYKEADEYTYYKMNTPTDQELIQLK